MVDFISFQKYIYGVINSRYRIIKMIDKMDKEV